MFKFIHAADIHLDSPLRGLSNYEGAPVALMRNATREAFRNLIRMAIEEEVAFIIIAGDLYDGDWRDFNTGLFFISQMSLLRQNGIRCYLLYGNHDAESQITKGLHLPDNVFVFAAKAAESFIMEDIGVALHGRSFKHRETVENLAVGYPIANEGLFNIGILHTALEGYAEHASYAPCSIAELKAKNYHYWALGHVHRSDIICTSPHIVFPGNLQGRHIREEGAKGAALVAVEDNNIINLSWLYPDIVRWKSIHIDISACQTLLDILECTKKMLTTAVQDMADGRLLAVRLTFTGFCKHRTISDEMQFKHELRALATGNFHEALWIEKIQYKFQPHQDGETIHQRQDAVEELRIMLEKAMNDEAFVQKIDNEMESLINRLPPEVFSNKDLELVQLLKSRNTAKLIEDTAPFLLSSLNPPQEH